MTERRKQVTELLQNVENGETAVIFEDLDDAILGIDYENDGGPRLVYDKVKCIRSLMAQNGWEYPDAEEWFVFNVAGSQLGPQTPVFIETL